MLIVDSHADRIAARLIHTAIFEKAYRGVVEITGKSIEWPEHMLCWLEDGLITRIVTFSDADSMRRNSPTVTRTPDLKQRKAKHPVDLAENYPHYIHAINSLTMGEHFPKYCHPQLTHNTRQLSIDQYRLFIESSFEEIQGLTFTVKELVVDDKSQHLAARLEFSGRPVKDFMGIQPTGKEVHFWEHVYHVFDEGKITLVWAMLDLEAYWKSMNQ